MNYLFHCIIVPWNQRGGEELGINSVSECGVRSEAGVGWFGMANSGDGGKKKGAGGGSRKSPQELIDGFNALRVEQRQVAAKIYELENDLAEHK